VVVLDFGLIWPLEPAAPPERGERVGTLAYASPEQCEGRPLREASDWYSVGVLLYETLTGQRPYRTSAIRNGEARRPPTPPTELRGAVPLDLSSICLDLLRYDPEKRPSGEEILSRLTRGAGERPSRSTPSVGDGRGRSLLVGRQAELDLLREAFVEARRARRPRVAWGESASQDRPGRVPD
jgi:serine/threonine protein kinase